MVIAILVNILAFFVFLFVVWKRLKEDYSSENIFSLCFVTASGLMLGYFAAKLFAPQYWFWMEILGILLGYIFLLIKIRLKFYETFEALFIAFLTWFGIYWLMTSFLATLLVVCFIVLFYLLDANYKNFTWYKSGRIGFSGLVTAGLFFLTRSAVVEKVDAYLSGITSFIMFLLVYNLARE